MRCSSAGETMSLSRRRRRRLRLLPFKQCCPPIFGRRTRPEPVTLKRFAAARFVFIFGIGVTFSCWRVPARRSAPMRERVRLIPARRTDSGANRRRDAVYDGGGAGRQAVGPRRAASLGVGQSGPAPFVRMSPPRAMSVPTNPKRPPTMGMERIAKRSVQPMAWCT